MLQGRVGLLRRRGPTRSSRRLAGALLSMRLLAGYGLGAVLISVPVDAISLGPTTQQARSPHEATTAELPARRALAAVASGAEHGFVLDREGHVTRVSSDGSMQRTASVGPYSTPFGTAVDGRIVFGGVRCDGPDCLVRIAEITVLDGEGAVETAISLEETSGDVSVLDGLALVGHDGATIWVNGGDTLFQVSASPAGVVAEVPWLGGEPCVVDGSLYDLVPSGDIYGRQGTELATTAPFRLRLHFWSGGRWRSVDEGAISMPYGQNAHCSPGGYEIRGGDATSARWEPASGWQATGPGELSTSPMPQGTAVVTSSTGARYAVDVDGSLLDVTEPGASRSIDVTIPGWTTSSMPPAVQVDDADGGLFWCATTYGEGRAGTRCATAADVHEPGEPVDLLGFVGAGDVGDVGSAAGEPLFLPQPSDPSIGPGSTTPPPATNADVHHYNMCSAACGGGIRSHSRDVVAWFVDRYQPAALSLNELCYDDGIHLTSRLPGFEAGASYVAFGTATNCPGAVKQFGNQIRVQADWDPGPGSWTQLPTQVSASCDHRRQECRGMACAEAGVASVVFCSAHLESPRRDPSVPEVQADEYRQLIADRYGNQSARVLAGDFNLGLPDADARLVPAGYQPATTGPTVGGHRPSDGRQIDMIYYDGPERPADSAGTTYCDAQASDHCYLMGRIDAG